MSAHSSTIAVIPARGGSKRLPKKNIYPLLGKPLLAWVIEALQSSESVGNDAIFVSTDSPEVEAVALKYGAQVIERPAALASDAIWTEPVIRHALETVESQRGKQIEYILWMNASIPEVRAQDIDLAMGKLQSQELREVFAVDEDGICTSAVRVMRRQALYDGMLSVRVGVISCPYVDIHVEGDVVEVARRLQRRQADSA